MITFTQKIIKTFSVVLNQYSFELVTVTVTVTVTEHAAILLNSKFLLEITYDNSADSFTPLLPHTLQVH